MGKHTHTEWKWDGRDFVYALNAEGSNRFFCGIQGGWSTQGRTRTDGDELIANARLIAAAPDLLEALNALLSRAKKEIADPEDVGEVYQAERAIAKATGETP